MPDSPQVFSDRPDYPSSQFNRSHGFKCAADNLHSLGWFRLQNRCVVLSTPGLPSGLWEFLAGLRSLRLALLHTQRPQIQLGCPAAWLLTASQVHLVRMGLWPRHSRCVHCLHNVLGLVHKWGLETKGYGHDGHRSVLTPYILNCLVLWRREWGAGWWIWYRRLSIAALVLICLLY